MYTNQEISLKLKELINIDLFQGATISSPLNKGGIFKIKIKAVNIRDGLCFQFSEYIDNKVLHKNYEKDELFNKIIDYMLSGFKQCVINADKSITVLMNKKQQFTITGLKENKNAKINVSGHNREKNHILSEGELIPWMYKLGLMDKDGNVLSHKQKKFKQINRFLEMLKDVEDNIPEGSTIIDMGCGKSYLTFAMYHYLNIVKNKNINIKGFDLKSDVVDYCNSLTEQFGFDKLRFYADDIANIDNIDGKISMIITLHACNTATDIAIYHGIRWECKVIMSVPCCQHELYPQIKNNNMSIILKHGILKERFSAIMTDAIRAEILEIMGYKTSVMEFIDMEHTPKNIMIRAVKGNKKGNRDNLDRLLSEYNIKQTLYELCFKKGENNV